MRKVMALCAAIVGALLIIVGVGGLIAGRGSDTVRAGEQRIDLAGATGLVSTAAVLPIAGVDLVVTARAEQGRVLVGAGHPVDVRDYLAGQPLLYVTGIGPGGLDTEPSTEAAGSSTLPQALQDTTFWQESSFGEGSQRLTVPLDGTPIRYTVVPETAGTAVVVSQGFLVPGLRLACGLSVLIGLLLIVVVLVVRRRERAAPGLSGGPAAVPAAHGEDTEARLLREATTPTRPPSAGRAVALAVPLMLALGGCAAGPRPAPQWQDDTVAKPALTSADVPAMLAEYDVRNNAAIAETAATGDPSAWSAADSGAVLQADQFTTRLHVARGDATGEPITHEGTVAYAAAFTAYPMEVLVESQVSGTAEDAKASNMIARFTKTSAVSPWMLSSNAPINNALPQPLVAGTASTASTDDRARAAAARDTIGEYLRTGSTEGLTLDGALQSWDATVKDNVQRTVAPYDGFGDPFGPDASLSVVRAKGALLGLAVFSVHDIMTATPGTSVYFGDEDFAQAIGQPGLRSKISETFVVSVVYTVDEQGRVTTRGGLGATVGG